MNHLGKKVYRLNYYGFLTSAILIDLLHTCQNYDNDLNNDCLPYTWYTLLGILCAKSQASFLFLLGNVSYSFLLRNFQYV